MTVVEAGRFVDGLKAAGVESFAGCTFPARPAPVKFSCGCHFTGDCGWGCDEFEVGLCKVKMV